MRAACWGSGLDSSPLLRLACLQAGRRQHCQPRQVRKKAAVTAAAGCPAHKSRERGNVRGFLRLQQAIWQGAFLGEGSPLISAVDARKAPLSLTGTALWAAIRSLPTRAPFPKPHPLPSALGQDRPRLGDTDSWCACGSRDGPRTPGLFSPGFGEDVRQVRKYKKQGARLLKETGALFWVCGKDQALPA